MPLESWRSSRGSTGSIARAGYPCSGRPSGEKLASGADLLLKNIPAKLDSYPCKAVKRPLSTNAEENHVYCQHYLERQKLQKAGECPVPVMHGSLRLLQPQVIFFRRAAFKHWRYALNISRD